MLISYNPTQCDNELNGATAPVVIGPGGQTLTPDGSSGYTVDPFDAAAFCAAVNACVAPLTPLTLQQVLGTLPSWLGASGAGDDSITFAFNQAGFDAAAQSQVCPAINAFPVAPLVAGDTVVSKNAAGACTRAALATVPDLLTPSASTGLIVTDQVFRDAISSGLNRTINVATPGQAITGVSTDGNGNGTSGVVIGNGNASGASGVVSGSGTGSGVYALVDGSGTGNGVAAFMTGSGDGNGVYAEVGRFASSVGTGSAGYFINYQNGTRFSVVQATQLSTNTAWGFWTNGAIFTSGGVTTSDKRVKRDIQAIDTKLAIELSKRVQFYDFDKLLDASGLKKLQAERNKKGELALKALERSGSKDDAAIAAAKADIEFIIDVSDKALTLTRQAGVIAQELQELTRSLGAFEYLVKQSDPNDPESILCVDYQSLDIILRHAERARIDALEAAVLSGKK